jgi:hypothetical protein
MNGFLYIITVTKRVNRNTYFFVHSNSYATRDKAEREKKILEYNSNSDFSYRVEMILSPDNTKGE